MSTSRSQAFRRIVENPYLNIAVGLIFLATGIAEVAREIIEVEEEVNVGAHHGVVIFAILHLLRSLPELFEGLEYLQKGGEDMSQ